jgi:uncharacterized protein (TIGR04255 family)
MTPNETAVGARGPSPKYRNPPIVEALCQFNFATPLSWNPILPGVFYQKIKAEYLREPEMQEQVQANVETPVSEGAASVRVGRGEQRLIYANMDGNRLVVLNPGSISANSMPPYEGWEDLADRLKRCVEKTYSTLGRPGIKGVSIRYINRILIPSESEISRFFRVPIMSTSQAGSSVKSLFQRAETILEDGVSRSAITFATVEPTEDEVGEVPILLDLEFSNLGLGEATIDEAIEVAAQLKEFENVEFEAFLTDDTRGMFR